MFLLKRSSTEAKSALRLLAQEHGVIQLEPLYCPESFLDVN
jgi:hypothetical protein